MTSQSLFPKDRRTVTYAESNGHREEVDTSLLGDGFATRDTWEVDEGRFDNAFLALRSLDQFLGEAIFVSISFGFEWLESLNTGNQRRPLTA